MSPVTMVRTTLICLACSTAVFAQSDPIEESLIQAKKQFDSALEKVRESVLEALDKKYNTLMKNGDLKGLEAVQAEMDVFKETGKWPQSIPTKGFDSQVTLARKRMEKAFEESKTQYTKAGKLELAKAVQKELEEFKLDQTIGLAERGVMPSLDAKEWVAMPSGLKVWNVKEGFGRAVGANSKVVVHYTGWLVDGSVFDRTKPSGKPAELTMDKVVPGWREGMIGMKPGGIRRLVIPANLAYGKNGAGKAIPPDSLLIFQIELIEIKD